MHTSKVHRIHCARNVAAKEALKHNCDFLLFCDPDQRPDARMFNEYIPRDEQPNAREWALPFVQSSLDFMLSNFCSVVAAPLVSCPPALNINVFPFRENGQSYSRMTHEELAAIEPQFQQVAAMGTGLMLIDCNVLRAMPEPWFEDAYQPDQVDEKTGKVTRDPQYDVMHSQDTRFCFKVNDLRGQVYCNHFAPAGHIKPDMYLPPACGEPIDGA